MFSLPTACSLNTINADLRFLLAQLHMDSFLRKPTPGDIKLALRNLPRGIKGLDMMYDQAVKRIEGQEEGFRELAKHVLSWITHAKRPLTTAELRHALAVRDGAVELDEDFVPDIEDLFSVCAGLITVDEQSHFIRWIHYTTQEYFERTWTLWTPRAQAYIASVCLTYLSFDTFESGSCPTDEEFENRLRLYPFYDYAARNWGYHAGAASIEVEQLIRGLLENDAKVAACSQAMMASKLYPGDSGYSQRVPRQIAGVHLAAYFGLKEAMAVLLKNGHDPNTKDGFCWTPLSWAAEKGHDTMVRQLLATDGVDPNCGDNDGLTPLSRASWNGHEVVVQLLLATDDVDPGSKDNSGQTPLSWAAKKGHEAVVRQLLATDGVDPDSGDSDGLTALSWASWNGQEAVVKLLLATDAVNPDSKGRYGRTPLSWAAENGHEAVVELLLRSGCVDVNSKDIIRGRTPLSLATDNGQEAVVKLLLASDGVDPDSKDKYGRTPLSLAAENGQEALVELLLAADGVDVNSRDTIRGRTPLSRAAENGHEAVARLLLATVGVDPDSKSNTGWTPLLVAARNGREAVVKLLLATHGIDPDSKDNDGGTPLSWAAANGHEAVVELLLATDGVDPDSRDRYGQPPLLVAARNGHQAVVKLLLATHGIDPNPKDTGGETPLYWAASRGHSDVIKLLLEKCKENGIAVRDKDMDIARQLEANRRNRMHCDICMSRIPDVGVYYHCRICNEGDFDICQECIASGAFCHDQSHKLIKETVKDGD
jgi:ankyrin repeat protein